MIVVLSRLLLFGIGLSAVSCTSHQEFLTGNQFLLKGQFSDALSHYHKAIELDSHHYQAIFRRATTYLALGRPNNAMTDLNTVLIQKPDFGGARSQRANIRIKMGLLDEALDDLQLLESTDTKDKIELIENNKNYVGMMKSALESGDCSSVIDISTQLLETQTFDVSLYQTRATCYEETNEIGKAIHDLRNAIKLSTDSTETMYKASNLLFELGEINDSLQMIRDCLKLNPDHKKCLSHYKYVRKIAKSIDSIKNSAEDSDWSKCLSQGEKLLKTSDKKSIAMNVYKVTCKCQRKEGNYEKAIEECSQILEWENNNFEVLFERADAYIMNEQYDEALADYQTVLNIDQNNETAKKGMKHAKRMKEQAGKRDYYKILNVSRTATKREITKAYRKLAQKWHPDNYTDANEKKKAEQKFIDIASAKEVLTDEEKRRQFDNGFDPLDSDANKRQQHSHEFHGGFNPFASGHHNFFYHY